MGGLIWRRQRQRRVWSSEGESPSCMYIILDGRGPPAWDDMHGWEKKD